MKRIPALAAALYGVLTLLVAIGLAWFILAKVDYAYSVWLDHAGIAQAIDKYAPQNRYKSGFELTSRAQRIAVFGEIAQAVHNGGRGLALISYPLSDGRKEALLHEAEIIHLQDVARVISVLVRFFVVISLLWLVVSLGLLFSRGTLPSARQQIVGFLSVLGVSLALIFAIGWIKVFNQLHVWVFPDEHQWFFYYQDSLMSTLMWAPNLFTYIGIAWLVLASALFMLLQLLQVYARRLGVFKP